MDSQGLVQGVIVVRAVIDAVKGAVSLLPFHHRSGTIPVYRLVSRQQMLLDRPAIANELVRMRWPR